MRRRSKWSMPPSVTSVSGTGRRCRNEVRRHDRHLRDLGDDAREDPVIHPPQLDGHAGAQLLEAIRLGEDLVIGGHARREVRLQRGPAETGGCPLTSLPLDNPPRPHPPSGDRRRARRSCPSPPPARRPRPREHLGDVGAEQIRAGQLEAWLGGTHDGACTMKRTGRPRLASTVYRTPATPATLASSCGSTNTVVVPRGHTASA